MYAINIIGYLKIKLYIITAILFSSIFLSYANLKSKLIKFFIAKY